MQGIGVLLKNGGRRPPMATFSPKGGRKGRSTNRRFNQNSSCSRRLLHQRFGFGAEILPRGVARIEHVPARIHDKLHTIGRSIGRQLIEQNLRTEIGRGKIEQSMSDKQLQLGIERENLPELGGRFQRIEAAAEVPASL